MVITTKLCVNKPQWPCLVLFTCVLFTCCDLWGLGGAMQCTRHHSVTRHCRMGYLIALTAFCVFCWPLSWLHAGT